MDTDTGGGQVIDADLFVSAEEAARLAGVSARTVRRWINAGDVQAADGPKGRTVSVSDVRRRAALGHDRSRPSRPQSSPRTDTDMDGHAVMSAVSASIAPQLTEITEQIERLTREIGEANTRAAVAELRFGQERAARETVERERDELRAEVELLREIRHVTEQDDDENSPDAPTASPAALGREQPPVMSNESLHRPSWLLSAWQRLLGRS